MLILAVPELFERFSPKGMKSGHPSQKSPILVQIWCKNAIDRSQSTHSKAGQLLRTPSPN